MATKLHAAFRCIEGCPGEHALTEAIYRCCIGAPAPARGAPLQAYLRHNQVETGLFFSAYPDATVETVIQALSVRQRVIDFGVAAQRMPPEDLLDAFRREF